MSKGHDSELEGQEVWDFERPEVREPIKAPRVVASVAFRRDDFERVFLYAQRIGKRTSEFIREAAIEKATGSSAGTLVYLSGSTGTLWLTKMLPVTDVFGSPVEDLIKMPVTTY